MQQVVVVGCQFIERSFQFKFRQISIYFSKERKKENKKGKMTQKERKKERIEK